MKLTAAPLPRVWSKPPPPPNLEANLQPPWARTCQKLSCNRSFSEQIMDMGQGDVAEHSNLMSSVRHFHLLSAQITWFMPFFL